MTKDDMELLRVGDRVKHTVYGVGTVTSVPPDTNHVWITFDDTKNGNGLPFSIDDEEETKEIELYYDLDSIFSDGENEFELQDNIETPVDPAAPINNDGRYPETCYWCKGKLRQIPGGWNNVYDYCDKCKK